MRIVDAATKFLNKITTYRRTKDCSSPYKKPRYSIKTFDPPPNPESVLTPNAHAVPVTVATKVPQPPSQVFAHLFVFVSVSVLRQPHCFGGTVVVSSVTHNGLTHVLLAGQSVGSTFTVAVKQSLTVVVITGQLGLGHVVLPVGQAVGSTVTVGVMGQRLLRGGMVEVS